MCLLYFKKLTSFLSFLKFCMNRIKIQGGGFDVYIHFKYFTIILSNKNGTLALKDSLSNYIKLNSHLLNILLMDCVIRSISFSVIYGCIGNESTVAHSLSVTGHSTYIGLPEKAPCACIAFG